MRHWGSSALLLVAGCGELLGADFDGLAGGAGGGETGGAAGDAASDATNDAAQDAANDEPAESCPPVSCYDGPPGTSGIGACRAGTRSCETDAPTLCDGQVLPGVADRCVLDNEDVDCDGLSGAHVWSKRFGDQQLQRVSHAATDASGNVYVTGYTWGTLQINPTTTLTGSLYLIKLDPNGKVVWGKSWPEGQGVAVTTTPEGGVVLGAFLDDTTDFGGGPVGDPDTDSGVLVKFSSAGVHEWTRPVGLVLTHLRTRNDGKILFGGQVLAPPVWPTGTWPASTAYSAILGLLDASGEPVWIQDYAPDISVDRFAVDSQNAIWVTSKMWGIRFFGDDEIGQANSNTSFVAKLDPNGNPIWSRSLAPVPFYGRPALGVASDDSVWLATPFAGSLTLDTTSMTSAGEEDVGVLHLNSAGKVVHSARFGDSEPQRVWDAAVDQDDHFVIAGAFVGTMSAGPCAVSSQGNLFDAFLFKLDENANPLWMHAFGNNQDANFEGYPDDVFVAVGVSADNRILAVGTFDGQTNFGGASLPGWTGTEASDVVVARYAP